MYLFARYLPIWPGDQRRRMLLLSSTLISVVLALFLAVPTAHADSPFNGSGLHATDRLGGQRTLYGFSTLESLRR